MESLPRVLCVVIGSSKGFGRSIVLEMERNYRPNQEEFDLDFVLLSKDLVKTEGTKELLLKQKTKGMANRVTCKCYCLDVSKDDLETNLQKIMEPMKKEKYFKKFLFCNSGTLGPLQFIGDLEMKYKEIQETVNLNISSTISICSYFLKYFPDNLTIINISSLAALKPFASWGVYCICKAGRDMLMSVIAEENKDVKTLSYAPGPMDTDMQKEIREQCTYQPVVQFFQEMKEKGTLIDPNDSASKLAKLLTENTFKSGSHIDYYDI